MAKASSFEPDYTVAPGDTLRATIDKLGMTQSDLALRAGLSLKHVNQIIQGVAPLTPETALRIERVTGVEASFWNAYEARHRGWLARRENREQLGQHTEWLSRFPIAKLAARGIIRQTADRPTQLEQLWSFFGVNDQAGWESVWSHPIAAFRTSPSFQADPYAVATWLRLGELAAMQIQTRPYDAARFKHALHEARDLADEAFEAIAGALVDLCASAGVALVFIKDVGRTRASGAAKWLTPSKAMIVLSLRHQRDDRVWFSFFHEAAHILLHSKKLVFIDVDDGNASTMEDEANAFAANHLIPRRYQTRLARLRTEKDVQDFARELGIAPGIVVGRLQRADLWDWSQGNELRRPVKFGPHGVKESG